jgi:hypothetical protein
LVHRDLPNRGSAVLREGNPNGSGKGDVEGASKHLTLSFFHSADSPVVAAVVPVNAGLGCLLGGAPIAASIFA